MDDVTALASLLKQPSDAVRFERGTVVADTSPTPAHSRVQLADGRIISVLGAMVPNADTSVLVGGGVTMLTAAPRFGVTAVRTSGQAITSGSPPLGTPPQAITWPTITLDTHGYLTPGGSVITIRQPGTYSISTTIDLSRGMSGRCYLQLTASGSAPRVCRVPIVLDEDLAYISATLPLAVGDTVTVGVVQNTSFTVTVMGSLDVWRIGW